MRKKSSACRKDHHHWGGFLGWQWRFRTAQGNVNVGRVFVGKKNRCCLDEHFRASEYIFSWKALWCLSGLSPLIEPFDRLASWIPHWFWEKILPAQRYGRPISLKAWSKRFVRIGLSSLLFAVVISGEMMWLRLGRMPPWKTRWWFSGISSKDYQRRIPPPPGTSKNNVKYLCKCIILEIPSKENLRFYSWKKGLPGWWNIIITPDLRVPFWWMILVSTFGAWLV